MVKNEKAEFRISSILLAKCPACHTGKVLEGVFTIRRRCPHCDYDFYPEPGFYVGSIVVGFLIAAITTIPPMILLKVLDVDIALLIAFPFIEFIFVGTFLMIYSPIIWLHLQYRMSKLLDRDEARKK